MEKVVYTLSDESLERSDLEARQVWSEMYNEELLWDAVLQTEDGGKFKIHKIVMCLCSKYFQTLFTTRLYTDRRSRFCIPGVSSSAMAEIVKHAYSGWTNVTEENVDELLIAADYLSVLVMLKDCCNFLLYKMNFQNCISTRKFARAYFCSELEDAAHRFLMRRFVEVTEQSEEYLEMTLEEVTELLNSDYINVRNEELVWEAGLRWIEHRPEERKKYMNSIMRCVRLGLLDFEYFLDRVKLHKYVKNNECCKSIVIDTMKFLWDLERIGEQSKELKTPFLARPRIPFSILFAVGGWSGGSPTDLIETYDTKADRWIRVEETDPDGPRAYHELAVIGYDIYVIGGFDGNEYFNSCRCFNAITKKWRSVAPMHNKRCYVSVATVNDIIYAMGGYDGRQRQNSVEKYDCRTNQWTLVTPMNVQRSDASATTLNGCIYIVGGFNGSECLASGEYYDPFLGRWTNIAAMRQRRSGISVISHHGFLYAFGGFNGISRLSNGERYDPDVDQWSEVPDMFSPRSNFGIEVMDDMIFAIGGFNGVSTIPHVECFDERKHEWYEATDMSKFRSALATCVVSGLPNVEDYVHKDREGLMEEKRQMLLQLRNQDLERVGANHHLITGNL